jgi:hypothetical protein
MENYSENPRFPRTWGPNSKKGKKLKSLWSNNQKAGGKRSQAKKQLAKKLK